MMATLFAPPDRKETAEVQEAFRELNVGVPYASILDILPNISMILNEQRQVVFINSAALSNLQQKPENVIGARPGEILGCIHATEMVGGCGTSEACRVCGAVIAILEAIDSNKRNSKECRITTETSAGEASMDLLVTAIPIATAKGKFIIVSLDDISNTKRREVLERVFFHDIMNSLISLQACVTLLNDELGSVATENDYFKRMASTTSNLIDEVQQQREMITMEKGELVASFQTIDLVSLIKEVVSHVEICAYAKSMIILSNTYPELTISTDPVLLRRVIGNMLKNALEASQTNEDISIALSRDADNAIVEVHNDEVIPYEAQLQVFQRSFSTKGKGRGTGTYSMKILTEEYLKGKITFDSSEKNGTRFRIFLRL
jgi:K+-sensing histidine kinase KdpD